MAWFVILSEYLFIWLLAVWVCTSLTCLFISFAFLVVFFLSVYERHFMSALQIICDVSVIFAM